MTPALLTITDLAKSFTAPDGERTLIVDIPAFTLAEGEMLFLYTDGTPQYRVIFPCYKIGENIGKAHGQSELANALRDSILSAK